MKLALMKVHLRQWRWLKILKNQPANQKRVKTKNKIKNSCKLSLVLQKMERIIHLLFLLENHKKLIYHHQKKLVLISQRQTMKKKKVILKVIQRMKPLLQLLLKQLQIRKIGILNLRPARSHLLSSITKTQSNQQRMNLIRNI